MGIVLNRIDAVIQFLNLKISSAILPDLDDEERRYFDNLTNKVIAYLVQHKKEALTLEDLVIKLNIKITDAKILIPFINEVLEHETKSNSDYYN